MTYTLKHYLFEYTSAKFQQMSSFVFINLAIDTQWLDEDKSADRYRSIEDPYSKSSGHFYQFYGIFYCSSDQDMFVCIRKPNTDFLNYLEKRITFLPQLTEVDCTPSDTEKWLESLQKKLKTFSHAAFDKFIFAGFSKLEEKLLKFLTASPQVYSRIPHQLQSQLNKKEFLAKLALLEDIHFPKTEIRSTHSLLKTDFPYVVKLSQSSGGAGVFKFDSDQDPKFKFLSKIWPIHNETVYLVQDKFDLTSEYYLLASTESGKYKKLACYQIDFIGKYLSVHRRLDIDGEISIKMDQSASIISKNLIQNSYYGPFGFDGFKTEKEFFPCTDLNVRIDRVALIERAAEKFGLGKAENLVSIKNSFLSEVSIQFNEFCSMIDSLGLSAKIDYTYYDVIEKTNSVFLIIVHLIFASDTRETSHSNIDKILQFFKERKNEKF